MSVVWVAEETDESEDDTEEEELRSELVVAVSEEELVSGLWVAEEEIDEVSDEESVEETAELLDTSVELEVARDDVTDELVSELWVAEERRDEEPDVETEELLDMSDQLEDEVSELVDALCVIENEVDELEVSWTEDDVELAVEDSELVREVVVADTDAGELVERLDEEAVLVVLTLGAPV